MSGARDVKTETKISRGKKSNGLQVLREYNRKGREEIEKVERYYKQAWYSGNLEENGRIGGRAKRND